MEVLLLGNGFDLSLGLPTRYSDFLDAMNYLLKNRKRFEESEENKNITIKLADVWKECGFKNTEWAGDLSLDKEYAREIIKLADNNLWLNHFNKLLKEYDADQRKDKTWIDFENEFFLVNRMFKRSFEFENGTISIKPEEESSDTDKFCDFADEFLDVFFENYDRVTGAAWSCKYKDEYLMPASLSSMRKVIDKEKVVSKLISAHKDISEMLRLYLLHFVDDPVRENIANVLNSQSEISSRLKILSNFKRCDLVLTFNYTNTFEYILQINHRIRLPKGVFSVEPQAIKQFADRFIDDPDVLHLHGNVNSDIVLGYNEDTPIETDVDNIFDSFDKTSQRSFIDTTKEIVKYNRRIKINNSDVIIFVMGLSLGWIDTVVLQHILDINSESHNIKCMIYYHKDDVKKRYIQRSKVIFREKFSTYTEAGDLSFVGDKEREDFFAQQKIEDLL